MKQEIEKKVRSLCSEVGSAAAAQKADELSYALTKEYDARVAAGMSELDAYRAVLRNVDQIKELLHEVSEEEKRKANAAETPDAKAEKAARTEAKSAENKAVKILDATNKIMWLLTVAGYFIGSFATGLWRVSWLVFIWGAMVSAIIDTAKKIVRGKDKKKAMKSGLKSVNWLLATILFFLFGFATSFSASWIVFIFAAVVDIIIKEIYGK